MLGASAAIAVGGAFERDRDGEHQGEQRPATPSAQTSSGRSRAPASASATLTPDTSRPSPRRATRTLTPRDRQRRACRGRGGRWRSLCSGWPLEGGAGLCARARGGGPRPRRTGASTAPLSPAGSVGRLSWRCRRARGGCGAGCRLRFGDRALPAGLAALEPGESPISSSSAGGGVAIVFSSAPRRSSSVSTAPRSSSSMACACRQDPALAARRGAARSRCWRRPRSARRGAAAASRVAAGRASDRAQIFARAEPGHAALLPPRSAPAPHAPRRSSTAAAPARRRAGRS
jgi:hypothetical protein